MVRVVRTPGSGAQKLENILTGLKSDKVGKVGFFKESVYPDGTPVAYVAAIQEFGSPQNNIPPRSFMRTTIMARKASWQDLCKQGARAILNGNATIDIVLEQIGLQAAGEVAATIAKIQSPPLKEATVKARMRRRADKKTVGNLTKPLIDTGILFNAVSSKVEPK